MFLLPGFSGVMVFYLLPFLEVVRRSFLKSGNSAFVGIENYRTVWGNGAFVLAVRNTFLYMAVGVPLLMGISLILSLLLRNLLLRRRLVSAMLLPMAVPAAVMVLTLQILIDRQGVINGVLTKVSEQMAALPAFAAIDYLNTEWALVVVVCSFLWKNTGYMVILWLAGLAALPKEVEEAAQVDGAGELAVFVRIGIPLGMPGILSALVLGFLEYWNMMEQPLAFIQDKTLWPLSLYLPEIQTGQAGTALAASVVVLIPAAFVFSIGQDYLEQGIIASGIKE